MASHPIGAPGSVARRVHDALDAIDASLPPSVDAGDWCDNQYKRAQEIQRLIDAEQDVYALRILRAALERAQNVGD